MKMRLFLTALLVSMASGTLAQTVYHCGPDGRSYSQQPCADGRAIEVADARSDLERREGEVAASRQRRLAHAMERDRHAARAVPTRAVRLGARPGPQAASLEAVGHSKEFRAVGPAKKKRARRAA